MNVVGYWFSDKLALRASRARPLEPGEIPELEEMAADLARRAEVPVPRLYLIGSEQPNAFATGRNPSHAAVAVTDGLLQHLPAEEVRGVLAHELAHVKNRDILGRVRGRRSPAAAHCVHDRWARRPSPRGRRRGRDPA
jgi:heat shock protein HtpX